MEQHRANPKLRRLPRQARPARLRPGELRRHRRLADTRTTSRTIDASRRAAGRARSSTARRSCGRCCSGRPTMFRRCFAEKLLTYALGRGLEYYDKCALDEIVASREGRRRHVLRTGARDREVRPVPEAQRQTERIGHDRLPRNRRSPAGRALQGPRAPSIAAAVARNRSRSRPRRAAAGRAPSPDRRGGSRSSTSPTA